MTVRQLANMAGCSTDTARALVQELIDAGVCNFSETDGYFHPRIVAYEAFRQKCGRAGKRGGGNPSLNRCASTFIGSQPLKVGPKDDPKDGSKVPSPPDGFSLSHSLSSLPPSPGVSDNACAREAAEPPPDETGTVVNPAAPADPAAVALGDALNWARHWVSANEPRFLSGAGIRALAKLALLVGRERAIADASAWFDDKRHPFQYALKIAQDGDDGPARGHRNGATPDDIPDQIIGADPSQNRSIEELQELMRDDP